MSMWSLRWHFTNKSVTWAPRSIKSHSLSLSHSWTLWWRVRWLKQRRLEVAAELQQRWRRTNRRRKSIPRSSSSHREGSIIQRGASCWRCDRSRRRSTRKHSPCTNRKYHTPKNELGVCQRVDAYSYFALNTYSKCHFLLYHWLNYTRIAHILSRQTSWRPYWISTRSAWEKGNMGRWIQHAQN